jgi:hypothetical protein
MVLGILEGGLAVSGKVPIVVVL